MNRLKCDMCNFHWRDADEEYPRCHWESKCPGDKAPCEYDDPEPPEDWQDEC